MMLVINAKMLCRGYEVFLSEFIVSEGERESPFIKGVYFEPL